MTYWLPGQLLACILAHLTQGNQGLNRDELIWSAYAFIHLGDIIGPGGRNGKTASFLVSQNER